MMKSMERMDVSLNRVKNMTVGSPLKLLIFFSAPLIAANFGQQLYMIVDAIIVGRGVGVEALASVGATDWSYWLALWVVQALTQGFAIPISQYFGEGNHTRLRQTVAMSIKLCILIGIVLTVICLLIARPLLRLLQTPENIFAGALEYLLTMYGGILIVMAYNMAASILRALGDGKTPLIAISIAAVTNIILDLLFVLVFALERYELSDIKSFSVDNTQKLFKIDFKGQVNNFVIVYYDDKYALLRDIQGLQAYLEHNLKKDNQLLDTKIKHTYQDQIDNSDDYARRNVAIGVLTFLGNIATIPLISSFYFLSFLSIVLVIDAVGAVSLVINKKIQKKNESRIFAEKRSFEKSKQENIKDFKRLASSLKQVALKIKYNEKEEPTDSFDFTLSIENYFNEEKEKTLHFTL